MANGPIILDMLHPVQSILQFPTIGRVGDNLVEIPLWVKKDSKPYDLTDYDVEFGGRDAQGQPKVISQTPNGPAIQSGRIDYILPGKVFAAAGEYQEAWFRIKRKSDGQIVSSLNVNFNVLENNVEFGVSDTPYISDLDKLREEAKEIASELQKVYSDANNSVDEHIQEWEQKVNDLVTNENLSIDGIQLLIKTLRNQLEELKNEIEDTHVVKRDDLDKILADFVKTADTKNFQKIKLTNDDASAYYYIKKGDTPTFNDILIKNVGVKTFYLQANAEGGVSDSMRGIINTSNLSLQDSKTYGNAIGITNDGRMFRKTIVFNVPNNKYVISDWVAVDNGAWSEWITSGIVYSNGYSAYHPKDRTNRYRYKDVMLRNGDIERHLQVDISVTHSKGFATRVPVWTLPKSIMGDVGFWDFQGVTASSDSAFTSYTFNDKGVLSVHGSTVPNDREDAWLPFTKTFSYIYKKGAK